jgi:uncharacterized protein (DUF1330 family)
MTRVIFEESPAMAAYVIAELTVTDPSTFERYRDKVPATITAYGGRYVVRGGTVETLEGDWAPSRLVVLEFPDMATLKRWYNSPEYQEILPLRTEASDSNVIVVEGLS